MSGAGFVKHSLFWGVSGRGGPSVNQLIDLENWQQHGEHDPHDE